MITVVAKALTPPSLTIEKGPSLIWQFFLQTVDEHILSSSMSSQTEAQTPPWYRSEIGPRLKPRTRKLFETYSKVASADVEDHVYAMVSAELVYSPAPRLERFHLRFSPMKFIKCQMSSALTCLLL